MKLNSSLKKLRLFHMKCLLTCQMDRQLRLLQMCHKRIMQRSKQQNRLRQQVNSLFQFKLTFIIFGLILKVVILFVLNYSIMIKTKIAMNRLLCWKAMPNVRMLHNLV